jgi:flagellar hook assembly protein FlgD
VIHEFRDYNNKQVVWKGTNKHDEPVPDGTYYYIITIDGGGTYTGWVFVRGGVK